VRSVAPLLMMFATSGCVSEYHSDVHPVTVTTVIQNAPAPVTVIAAAPPVMPPEPVNPIALTPPSATYLGPGVSMGPGIYFGGDVYVSGDLIVGGTRENPRLMTR
jgi:hypothetical protein